MTRTRGTGHVKRTSYRNRQGQRVQAKTFHFIYYNRRLQKHEHVYGFRSQAAAEKALRSKLAEQDKGVPVGADVERATFNDMRKLIEADYENNGRDSLDRLLLSLTHLEKWFGEDRATQITDERVELYKAGRLKEKAAPATVNRELSALKRMFRLARRRVPFPPEIVLLKERNVRAGFFEEPTFEAARAKLPAGAHQDAVSVTYVTGWRMPSEVLTRGWKHVDFDGGWLVLEPGEAKSEEPRRFPLDPDLRPILWRRWQETQALQRELGRVIPWVFYTVTTKVRRVRRLGSFYKTWHAACRAAGIAGRIPHDFRRTAFRNLRRRGVDVLTAMDLVGWKSIAMAKRYGSLKDETLLREGAAKRQAKR